MTAALAMILALAIQDSTPRRGVESVPVVDLPRYAGLWYEVARLPNRFQARCRRETTATYELLPDSELRVVNSCRDAKRRVIRVEGRARLADRHGPASRLKVRFAPKILSFLPMVWGDYWILDIIDDYGAVLVGTPSREYLWILSRSPQLDEVTYRRLVATAAAQQFDVARLVRSP